MNAELFRKDAEVRDSDIYYSSVGPGHDRAYFSLIPLAGYSARSRFNDFPYFNAPFSVYSMSGWKSPGIYHSVAGAKRAIRRWILQWLTEAPQSVTWSALDTGVHWSAFANGIAIAQYYFCPEDRGNWTKGFRVWFGGTYYVTNFTSPAQARLAVQSTFTRWINHAKESLK